MISIGITGSRSHWKANMMGRSIVDMPNVMTIMRLARCKVGCQLKVYKAPAKVPTAIATDPAKPKIHTKKEKVSVRKRKEGRQRQKTYV